MSDPTCEDCAPAQEVKVQATALETPAEDILNPATFVAPNPLPGPSICRWLHRASWVSTELLITFPSPTVKAITIMPHSTEKTAGRFRVWLFMEDQQPILMWDRKVEGGFPELKVLVSSFAQLYFDVGQSTWDCALRNREYAISFSLESHWDIRTNPSIDDDRDAEWIAS
ncbi:hypothetical protein EIP91_011095 [Steccherinum ochraceum]|uniref:Uncharacterized protein n=1 Tax=Steccherinum ochraceum TaxID=92696 RepID=A0A4R0S3K8_9APHY|nr:hypothetical protein EIP91_011095 [Steccherinum ochraceum]